MTHLVSTEITKARISKWIMEAKPAENSNWTETRLALVFGGHTYIIEKDQVYQCAHCGRYDPKWFSVEVSKFFEENLGAKVVEVEITCRLKEESEE